MRTSSCLFAIVAGLLVTSSPPARAAAPYVVFVADADVTGDTGGTAGAITPSVCSALEKRPGLTVLCAPDVRQMLEAAAQLAAFGRASPALEKLQQRIEGAHFVVKPYLRKTDTGLKLLLRLYHQGEAAGGMVLPGKPAGRIVEVTSGDSLGALLDRLDAAAGRTEKMLYEPRNTPGDASNEPPAPLR